MTKKIIPIVLSLVIIFLAYMVYRSIMQPVRFMNEREKREAKVVQRLKDIRSAQLVFKSIYGRYTADFDTLVDFINNGKLPVVLKIGQTPDTITEVEALKLGIIQRDTTYISVKDSLFRSLDYPISELGIAPYTDGQKFEMETTMLDKGGYLIPVMECRIHYNAFLKGMDKQQIINHVDRIEKMEKYPGMKFGSMFDASTDGNWE